MSTHDLALLLTGAGGVGIIGGLPAIYLMRAQARGVDATTEHADAETDSVIVTTTERLVGIVGREVQRYEERVVNLENENIALRDEHRRCLTSLQEIHSELNQERLRSERQDTQIRQLVSAVERAQQDREHLTGRTEDLLNRVENLQAHVDATGGVD